MGETLSYQDDLRRLAIIDGEFASGQAGLSLGQPDRQALDPVLILIDLPQPTNYSGEGYRLLWTLCGAAIGVVVMLLAGLLAQRRAARTPQPAKQPA